MIDEKTQRLALVAHEAPACDDHASRHLARQRIRI
jgi:hypothetical protein